VESGQGRKTALTGKRIALFGTFDVLNYGDHLFPAIFRRALREFTEGADIALFSPSRGTDYFDGEPIHAFDDLGQEHLTADAFVIGGGDIVRFDTYPHSDPHGGSSAAYFKMLALAALHAAVGGKPLAWNAPGIPFPFTATQRVVMERILGVTGYVSVRDLDSKEHLRFWEGAAEVVPDSGFLLSKYFPKQDLAPIQAELREAFGLDEAYMVLHASPATTEKDQVAQAAEHVGHLAEALGLPVLLLPLGPAHGDRELLAEIAGRQPGRFRLLDRDFHPLEMASIIAHASFFVGTGLHGNITAASYRVPCAVVNLLDLSKLHQFGSLTGQPVLGAWSPLSEKAGALKAQEALSENRLNELQDQISEHFQTLCSYIAGAKPQPAAATRVVALVEALIESDRAARLDDGADSGKLEKMELENQRLEERCRELNANANAKNLRLSQLVKENIRFIQENAELAQSLAEVDLQNQKLQGSLVWLPLKPFRWLEKVIRRQRKKLQAKWNPPKIEEEVEAHSPLTDAANLLWEDTAVDYKRYLALCEQHGFDALPRTGRNVATLPFQPLISILVPVYNPAEPLLRKAIESVLRQEYTKWELCLADDASTKPHVKRMLQEFAQRDPRVRVVYREKNGHISEASNSALELATGEFSALLDHDDELTPDALSSVVWELNQHPDACLVYSDYDRIDDHGVPSDAFFKPDWNPDLLLSQNYICHLAIYRTALLRKIGGFRRELEGSQDWDLALRVTEQCRADQIRHIPRILYHWRKHEESASHNLSGYHYAVVAAKRAVTEHLARMERKATVMETRFDGWFRVRYAIERPPKVSIIICTRDRIDLLCPCIRSILDKTRYKDYEILVVDNSSREKGSGAFFDECRKSSRLRILPIEGEFNYSALNNRAAAEARGDILCFLNNDTVVISEDWLQEMVSHALRKEIGAVGAKLLYPDGRIQHAGIILGIGGFAAHVFSGLPGETPGYMGRAQLIQNYTAVTGACMVMRKSVFNEVGGFNERELKVAFNDIDLCLKIHTAGYRNLWTPYALLYHHESASRGLDITASQKKQAKEEADYFWSHWADLVYNDPAYNPNLSLLRTDFGMAFPPRKPRAVAAADAER
jgi:GT2 family glycosyltransferase/polysaccharide pyruvyl transferase WcaK-like protein